MPAAMKELAEHEKDAKKLAHHDAERDVYARVTMAITYKSSRTVVRFLEGRRAMAAIVEPLATPLPRMRSRCTDGRDDVLASHGVSVALSRATGHSASGRPVG
jgi:hypothetical protein